MGPKYRNRDGFLMPMGFPVENFDSALKYEAQPSDIFISTFPKCGTTWMQYLVYLLQHEGRPLSKGEKLLNIIPHLEELGGAYVAAMAAPRVIKTHLPFDMAPWHDQAKYINVVRNPKDCCVSLYHHTKNFGKHYAFEDGTWDVFFESFVRGRNDFNCYFDNLNSWYEHKDKPNVLFLTYEEMKADTHDVVRRIGRFLGGVWGANAQDADIVDKVVENSSLTSMKKNPEHWTFTKNDEFIRKGIVGDWTSMFTEAQSRRMDDRFKTKCKDSTALQLWTKYGIPDVDGGTV